MCHFFDGAVGVGASAEVLDFTGIPGEVNRACKIAEDILPLRVLQASYGPVKLDLVPVHLITQLPSKLHGELLDLVHQYWNWGLLQGDAL